MAHEVQSISKSDPLPFYAQLASILRGRIAQGAWAPGELLPSEGELCERYGLSRTAVRQALSQLVDEGLVRKEKGRGTFVSRPQISMVVQELRGFSEEMTARGEAVRTELIARELVPVPPEAAGELGVPVGSKVVLIDRVRHVGGEAVVSVRTLLPHPRFGALLDADLERRSLYELLRSDFGVEPFAGRRAIEAVPADAEAARRLGVPSGSALLRVSAVSLDALGEVIEHFVASYRGDRVSFVTETGRGARPHDSPPGVAIPGVAIPGVPIPGVASLAGAGA